MKIIVAFAMLLVGSHISKAEVATVFSHGVWTLAAGTGEGGTPMCGMNTHWRDGRYIGVKYLSGGHDGLVIHLNKDSWFIPENQTVDVKFEFDNMGPWAFDRAQVFGKDRNFIELVLRPDSTDLFLREFQLARRMRIVYPGDEPDWYVNMSGSGANALKFRECLDTVRRMKPRTTQPFDRPTQPFSGSGPTQPFRRL